MNKYEAAIAYFKERKSILAAKSFEDEAVEHINTAIEAMKKQIPRSLTAYDGAEGECRFCGNEIEDVFNYCGDCGQRISKIISECIITHCAECGFDSASGSVCECYSAKSDEIRRIHEEG